jgi:hypothetical protein
MSIVRQNPPFALSNERIGKVLWWACLIGAPAVLIGVELFHPAHFTAHPGMFRFLSKPQPYDPQFAAFAYSGPGWWFALHLIQTPVVALITVGLWLLAGRVGDADGTLALMLAWLARAAALVFLVYYTALDSIGGTGLGRLLLNAQNLAASGNLTSAQIDGIALLLDTNWVNPWVGGVGSFVSEIGSWAIFVATVFSAAALYLAGKAPWRPLILSEFRLCLGAQAHARKLLQVPRG